MAFEAAGGAGRVLAWILPPAVAVGAAVWLARNLDGPARWAALAVLAAVALMVAARFRLLAPLAGLALVGGAAWLVWYALHSSVWWPVWVVAGVLLVGWLARGRLAYWRALLG